MNLIYHAAAFAVLVAAVVALFLYRRWLENHEDHYIHLHNDAHDSSIIQSQTSMGRRLEVLDKIKTAAVVAAVLYLLAIGGMAVYQGWNAKLQP